MPLAMALAPGGARGIVILGGWREQGVQVVESATGRVLQTLIQPAAFVGVAFSPDGRSFFASGGNQDVVYRYAWDGEAAQLADSIVLAIKAAGAGGSRYPAGLAISRDGRTLFVAENLADSLAVVDLASKRVMQRVATDRYPYGVAVAANGTVYVSAWGSNNVLVYDRRNDTLTRATRIPAARHPSSLILNADATRLFVVSGSTDRVVVIDTKTRRPMQSVLADTIPHGSREGSTPNALALSADGTRLYVAEADANAVGVFDLSDSTSGVASARGDDRLAGRVAVGWYPTAVLIAGDQLLVANGKGNGTAPNAEGPTPAHGRTPGMREYTLGQLSGTLSRISIASLADSLLGEHSARVARLNGWVDPPHSRDERSAGSSVAHAYPPFTHVIYVIKENRTYDQVFGDLGIGDNDPSLLFFPRHVSPNHHQLAERFGVYDRFFVNAEVSPDGHNWSTAAYVTDYGEKTIPSNYSNRGRDYDYEGTNRGWGVEHIPEDDVNEPAAGYLWNLAERAGISFRNYGEFVVADVKKNGKNGDDTVYIGDKRFLSSHTNESYPGFDLDIPDQRRLDVWLAEFASYVKKGTLPALEIVRLPNDHTAGAVAGKPTPAVYFADNDLALGRMVEALSASPYWKNTVIFVVEDDAQNGPDHVDSHRAPFLVISAYNRAGVFHRWTNTTDVIATISGILHLGHLSQFDAFGRPLNDVFSQTPDTTRYRAIVPDVPADARNAKGTTNARESARLDLTEEDRADENSFNHILWRAIKGDSVSYPGTRRMSSLEWQRSR